VCSNQKKGVKIPEYPIIYEPSFVLFWGAMLALSIMSGNLLLFAYTAITMLVLIHHEHAHIKECLKRNVRIKSVTFTWWGGGVDADIMYAHDAVPILTAGVINTGCYAIVFMGMWLGANFLSRNVLLGVNVINNPYLQFLNSIALLSLLIFATNILPISHKTQKYGVVTTDGWGAYRYRELRDELWNDGKHEALICGVDNQ
jgi:hypothetical protein